MREIDSRLAVGPRSVHGLKLMVGPAGKRWVGMPDNKRRDRDDRPMLDANGDRASRDRFGDLVLAALRVEHPELFDGEGGS
jgi:hypothetical protein